MELSSYLPLLAHSRLPLGERNEPFCAASALTFDTSGLKWDHRIRMWASAAELSAVWLATYERLALHLILHSSVHTSHIINALRAECQSFRRLSFFSGTCVQVILLFTKEKLFFFKLKCCRLPCVWWHGAHISLSRQKGWTFHIFQPAIFLSSLATPLPGLSVRLTSHGTAGRSCCSGRGAQRLADLCYVIYIEACNWTRRSNCRICVDASANNAEDLIKLKSRGYGAIVLVQVTL